MSTDQITENLRALNASEPAGESGVGQRAAVRADTEVVRDTGRRLERESAPDRTRRDIRNAGKCQLDEAGDRLLEDAALPRS